MKATKKPNWLEQNPCDWYNKNKFEDALSLILRKEKTMQYRDGKLFSVVDREEIVVAEKNCQNLLAVSENRLGLVVGLTYSPFQILVKFRYQNNFTAAFQYVGMNYMDMDFPFIRIGVKYFKEITKPDRYGTQTPILKNWTKDEIKQDFGKEMMVRVQLYDDFIIEPNNEFYEKTYKGFYNLYQPFTHRSKEFDLQDLSKIQWSLKLLKHIFGEKIKKDVNGLEIDEFKLGLRYMKMLYMHPKRVTPILVLTSEERSTGKSTFIDWLNSIFLDNLVIITPGHISSDFNESYAEKNIIAIEESRFDDAKALEKLKALSTQKTISVNRKHIPTFSLPFYGKLIITSNDESKFSKVDEAEIRYWVRQIPTLQGIANHNILDDLISEIPYFLYYLAQQDDVDFSVSRQGFTAEEINTSALEVVKKESKPALQKEIEMYLQEFCMNETNEPELYFTATDVKRVWFERNNNFNAPYISKILSSNMRLDRKEKPERYVPSFGEKISKTGLFFTYKNVFYNEENNDKNPLSIEIDKSPF
tara:strand:- start:136 stop:1728 length:1593 start_codon:yes stop_codon:yes gene_type:complete